MVWNWLRFQQALFERAPYLLAVHVLIVLISLFGAVVIALPLGVL